MGAGRRRLTDVTRNGPARDHASGAVDHKRMSNLSHAVNRTEAAVDRASSRFKRMVTHPLRRALLGYPLAMAGLMLAPLGLAKLPVAAQRALAEGIGTVNTRPKDRRTGYGRAVWFSLVSLLPATVAFVIAAVTVLLVFTGYLYPVYVLLFDADGFGYLLAPFSAQPGLEGAWGGPTLVGAWFVHAGIAVPSQAAGLALCFGYSRLQDALVRGIL